MRKALVGLPLTLVAAIVFLPATALGAEYTTFVGCDDLATNPIPSHECEIGDFPAAYFESDVGVEYDVCVEFPDAEFLCSEENFAPAETLFLNSIETSQPGRHHVYWYLSGTETMIGFWAFDMTEPPPSPPPPTSPLAPPTVTPPAPIVNQIVPSTACVKARNRVRRLQGQLRRATSRIQKVGIRSKLKKARAAVRRAC